MRRMTCCSRASASRPFSPPTSMSVAAALELLADGVSEDAGIETTSIAPGTALTASVSVCAKVNWVSNVPPARSSRPKSCRA